MSDETQSGRDDYVTEESGQAPVPWRTDDETKPVQEFAKILAVDSASGEVTSADRFARRPRVVMERTDLRSLSADVMLCAIVSSTGTAPDKSYGVQIIHVGGVFTGAVTKTGVLSGSDKEYEIGTPVLVMTDGRTEDGYAETYLITGDFLGEDMLVKIVSADARDTSNEYIVRQCDKSGNAITGTANIIDVPNIAESSIGLIPKNVVTMLHYDADKNPYINYPTNYPFRAEITGIAGAITRDLKILDGDGNIPAGTAELTDFNIPAHITSSAGLCLDLDGAAFPDIATAVPGLTWTAWGSVLADWLPAVGDKIWAMVTSYGDRWVMTFNEHTMGNY